MIINLSKDFGIVTGDVDNAVRLMEMRLALCGKNKPHYVLLFPAGEIRYSNNRWLFGVYSFEALGNNTILRSIYDGQDDAFQRPLYVGELLQNNTLDYIGNKQYVTADKFEVINAELGLIRLLTSINKYFVGDRSLLYAGNYADHGYPPPAHSEWNIIDAIEGVVFKLRKPLLKQYPTDVWDNPEISGGGCGLPRIVNLDRAENVHCKYAKFKDITFANATGGGLGNFIFSAEEIDIIDCITEGYFWPSETRRTNYKGKEIGHGEFDKIANEVYCDSTHFKEWVGGGGGIDKIVISNCKADGSMQFNPSYLEIRNTHLTSDTTPDPYVAALADYPARNPGQQYLIENLTFSNGPNSKAESHINCTPHNSIEVTAIADNCILTKDFTLVKTIEPGVTTLYNKTGTNGGVVASISRKGDYFVIKGNWHKPLIIHEVYSWCYVKELIDLGGHINLGWSCLFGNETLKWKGNSIPGDEHKMVLDQNDFKWAEGKNGNLTVDLYGYITSIVATVSVPYKGVGAKANIEITEPYTELLSLNLKKISVYNMDIPTAWIEKLNLNTFNVTDAVTADFLPKFQITIKWRSF